VMEANLKAMNSRDPNHQAIARYIEIAQILTGDENAAASDGVKWVGDLVHDLNIPALSVYGMKRENFLEAVEKALQASSIKGNPIPLTNAELKGILESAL
jgi:alcohol dehydrogenase class IV